MASGAHALKTALRLRSGQATRGAAAVVLPSTKTNFKNSKGGPAPVRRGVPGFLDYRGWPRRRLHSPRSERMRENIAVTPSACSVQTNKKAGLDLAISPRKTPPAWCPRFAPVSWALTCAEEDPSGSSASFLFTIRRCPLGFDLDDSGLPQSVMAVAAPLPVIRFCDQSALYRLSPQVPVQVAQLQRELVVVPHIAVVIARRRAPG